MVTINNRDPRPVDEQVKEGFKRLIIAGVLSADEKMPSVRELAGQLAINPNTIQRAYRELEAEGWCYSVPGTGSFAGERQGPDRAKIEKLLAQLRALVSELRYLGAGEDEIARCLQQGGDVT